MSLAEASRMVIQLEENAVVNLPDDDPVCSYVNLTKRRNRMCVSVNAKHSTLITKHFKWFFSFNASLRK